MDVTEIEPVDIEKAQAENPQSRFRVVENANLAPGVCALCGSAGGDGRQFVDFGKTMDWYGVVYFCTFCIAEASKLIGFAPKAHFELALSNYQEEVSVVDGLYVGAKEKLDAAMVLLRNCTCSDSGIGVPAVEVFGASVVDDGDSESEPEPNATDESDIYESDPVQGSDDVPTAPSSDDEPESKPVRRTRKSTG